MSQRWTASMLRAGGILAVLLLLLLTVLDLPTQPYDLDHDRSSSAALEYYAARGVQFGTELIQNVGPLGWVQYSGVYGGFLGPQKIVLGLLRAAALGALALWACTRFRGPVARVAWLLTFIGLIPLYPIGEDSEADFPLGETWTYLCAYLSGLALLALPRDRRLPVLAALPLGVLAFLSLIKHTLLFVALSIVGCAIFERLRSHAPRSALLLLGLYTGGVALFWAAAGQSLANLPAFGLGVLRFTNGYNEAMALPSDAAPTALGLTIVGGLAALIGLRSLGRSQSAAKSLIDAFFLFILWKHGFVRGDAQHVAIFFHTSAFLGLLFGLGYERPREIPRAAEPAWTRRLRAALAPTLLLASGLGLLTSITDARYRPDPLVALWQRNLEWLVAPVRRSDELSRALIDREDEFRLPGLHDLVGGAPIDSFGSRLGWVLLNHLAYTPRPMPISFAAANESLQQRNESFYRDPARAPRFILCELGSIDDRLVPLDDALALGAILDDYHPVVTWGTPDADPESPQQTPVLLERNAPADTREQAGRTLLTTKQIGFGEAVSLEPFDDAWLWLAADIEPSLLGRLRALWLRPAQLEIALDVESRETPLVRRYVSAMGRAGFLISPLLETNRDLLGAYGGVATAPPPARIRSLRFECAAEDCRFFEPAIRVRIYRGSAPPGRAGGTP